MFFVIPKAFIPRINKCLRVLFAIPPWKPGVHSGSGVLIRKYSKLFSVNLSQQFTKATKEFDYLQVRSTDMVLRTKGNADLISFKSSSLYLRSCKVVGRGKGCHGRKSQLRPYTLCHGRL